jgi:hypothetical protein
LIKQLVSINNKDLAWLDFSLLRTDLRGGTESHRTGQK